jgi:hypothetical protein
VEGDLYPPPPSPQEQSAAKEFDVRNHFRYVLTKKNYGRDTSQNKNKDKAERERERKRHDLLATREQPHCRIVVVDLPFVLHSEEKRQTKEDFQMR